MSSAGRGGARKRTRSDALALGAKPCSPRFTRPPRTHPTPPTLKRAGYDHELEKDSVLLRASRNYYPEGEGDGLCSEFPPLMQRKSWTRGVPYRDSYDHSKPVDSTGNCYTVNTKTMRVVNMPPKKRKPPQLFGPLGPNGEIQFPPLKPWHERERERLEAERKEKERGRLQKGLVLLEDLVSGAYDRKKQEEAEAKRRRIEKRRQKKEAEEKGALVALKKHLEKLESELPCDPDQQKEEMIRITEEEHYKYIHPNDLERIKYYLTTSLVGIQLPDFPVHLYKKAKAQVDKQTASIKKRLLILTYQACVRQSEADIKEFFTMAMKRCILSYILEDPTECQRLSIAFLPPLWPALVVRAPVPWHTTYVRSKQAMHYRFYQGNPIVLELRQMWQERYENMLICDMNKMQDETEFPQYIPEFTEKLTKLCNDTRTELVDNWLIDVADTMIKMRKHWAIYVSKKKNESVFQVEKFFSCIHALMSRQVRDLVERSVYHFAEYFKYYWDGNNYNGEYEDYMFIKRPLIRIKVNAHLGTTQITFEPTLEQMRVQIVKWFHSIINVIFQIPSVDSMLYPGTIRPMPHLFNVYPNEQYMVDLINECVKHFYVNRPGPIKYLSCYCDYYYILDGTANQDLLKFFAQEPPPYLKDFSARIYMYEALRDEILFLRRDIPLNMIMLDCGPMNDSMWAVVDGLRQYIVDHFININRKWNRSICNVYEEMAARASESPETTAQLVELINYIQDCRDSAMFDLREKARTTAEYVLFLMQHAHLIFEDINLNTRVFLWPLDMEETIDLTLKTLNTKKSMAEDKLRSRKAIFEEKLKRHEKELEQFRRFDPPLLNLDLLKEVVAKVDEIFKNLTEDKYEAEDIINEETLLDQEVSVFFSLQTMLAGIDPFHKLWHTSLDFYDGYEKWYKLTFNTIIIPGLLKTGSTVYSALPLYINAMLIITEPQQQILKIM